MQIKSTAVARFAVLLFVAVLALPAFAAEGYFERTLQVNGAVNLDVTSGSGNVDVHVGNSNQVKVIGHIKANNWFGGDNAEERIRRIESNPPVQQSGNSIRIGHIDDSGLRHNISISYEVTVPEQTQVHSHTGSGNQTIDGIRDTLDVGSGSGNLRVSNIGSAVRADAGSGNVQIDRVQGNVRAKTGSGEIRATSIAGGFEADAGSGNIRLEQTSPGAVRVETGSGGIELRGVQGSLQGKTGSGSINVNGSPTGMWSLSTGSGSVRVRLVSEPSFDLEAHTGSGSISLKQAIEVQGSISRKDIRGKVRGGGVPVRIETGSGGIEIE